MRLILLGPPGSGKGTQAVGLAAQLQVPHIATGDLFRSEMAADSELGKLAKRYISRGNLVPDDVVNAMLARHAGSVVAAAIIDDEELDLIDTLNVARQCRQGVGQVIGLVEARYLDDQLGHKFPRVPCRLDTSD